MKQLVYAFNSKEDIGYFVVALQDRAFVCSATSSSRLLELQAPAAAKDAKKATNTDKQEDEPSKTEIPLQQIQAVAGCVSKHDSVPVLYVAVARQSKQLCIYRVLVDQLSNDCSESSIIQHLTLHQSPKRVSSMVFAEIPGRTSTPLTVLITGDLAGDAFAYSLTQPSTEITAKEAADEGRLQHRRLLLGHTASMITSVALCTPSTRRKDDTTKFILTADRDEKIRVTAFPSTFEIHGFLFGHKAFVSCMVVSGDHCFSCGGDFTLRVWDVSACQEQACLDLQTGLMEFEAAPGVPCDMCVGEEVDGTRVVAVIYDRSTQLDLFSVETSGNTVNVVERTQIILSGQPLGLASMGSKFIVLVQEPHYVQCFNWKGQLCDLPPVLQQCKESAITCQTTLPTSILERDENGELKMSKNVEKRGSGHIMPWNDVKRKDIASASKRRHRKRRRKNRKQDKVDSNKEDDDAVDSGEDEDDENGEKKAVLSEGSASAE